MAKKRAADDVIQRAAEYVRGLMRARGIKQTEAAKRFRRAR